MRKILSMLLCVAPVITYATNNNQFWWQNTTNQSAFNGSVILKHPDGSTLTTTQNPTGNGNANRSVLSTPPLVVKAGGSTGGGAPTTWSFYFVDRKPGLK
jgi:hypothetical protein